MQAWDQVKIKKVKDGEGDEHLGRAGVVESVYDHDGVEMCTVKLDETPTHEAGTDDYPTDHLEFLGR